MHRLRKTSVVLLGTTLLGALWPAAGWAGPPPVVFSEAISRPVTVSVRNPETPVFVEVNSRPWTINVRLSELPVFVEVNSRPVSISIRESETPLFVEANSRPLTVSIRNPSFDAIAEVISQPLTVRVGDCNGNFILDADDVSGGSSPDDNANGLPDECDICGDLDADLDVDGDDFALFLMAFSFSIGDPEYDPEADYDLDGTVRTSTSLRICLRRSLWATPKRCSSSTITRPKSAKRTSRWTSRCVPIQMSIFPEPRPSTISFCSASERKRLSTSTRTG